ncbi:MAG: nuclear transport factor 2 family protein [Saccharospirillum sp.]
MTIIERTQRVYGELNAQTVTSGLLAELYDERIVFVDPIHRIEGLPALQRYFEGIYRNVIEIAFDYQGTWEADGEAMLRWEMTFRHPKLKGGQAIVVPGATYLQFQDKVTWHQDYFDSNQMIFDHTPVLGSLLGWLKNRLN